MIYLITQLAGFLLLALASAALVGWAYASHRAAPARTRQRVEREALIRDLRALATGDGPAVTGADPELASLRSRLAIESARAAEAERNLEAARGRAEEATGRIAEFQRTLEARTPGAEIVSDDALEVEATPIESNETALQAWRLRYFEQRVRYLESARAPTERELAAVPLAAAELRPVEWRARVAEARARHLEDELRDVERGTRSAPSPVEAPPEPEVSAFAADPETDALLRWRMLYLERRVAHLQSEAAQLSTAVAEPAPVLTASGPDPELWKWRARYLEARLRYLEAKASVIAPLTEMQPEAPMEDAPVEEVEAAEPETVAPEPLVPAGAEERPPTLPGARGGGPDDLTLIDGVSPMQQTTLNSLGIFHFDQVAAWTPANVAWVDQYLRLRGRIVEEEWVEQADDLARDGVLAARRVLEDEDA